MTGLLLCLFCSLTTLANDTTRVLFIGNSFVASNDLPGIFTDMATAAGRQVIASSHAPGGIFVADTRQGNAAHAHNPIVYNLIRSAKWDYVVIQDNQGFYSWNVGQFPAVSDVLNGHRKLRDSIVANNPCAKVVLFAGWCFKNGWQGAPPVFNTGSEMNERVYVNYNILNNNLQEIVSPIGIAWNRSIKDLPAIDLWSPDEAHPSYAGSYLAAATIYATVFRTSAESAMFSGQLDTATARHMRRTGYETVIDSIAPTALGKHTISLTYSGGQLSAPAGYAKYQWYKGDNTLAATTTVPVYSVVAGSGCYQVVATDNNGCRFRSVENCLVPNSIEKAIAGQSINIYPNPSNGVFNISTGYSPAGIKVQLYSLTGSLVYDRDFEADSRSVYRNELPLVPDGMYILKVRTGAQITTTRIQVKSN